MAKSAWKAPKPRGTLRPKSPCCPWSGAVKAALLKILPPGYCDPKSSSGTPETTLGRNLKAAPAAKEYPAVTFTGGEDRAKMKLSTDQSLKTARAMSFHPGEGRL